MVEAGFSIGKCSVVRARRFPWQFAMKIVSGPRAKLKGFPKSADHWARVCLF